MIDGKICYGYIFARGGSKGVPRKNIRPLAGRPLIAWSIDALRGSKYIDRVIVSTDDGEIADVSLKYGAEVPFMRPAALAADDAPELLAWRHALDEAERTGTLPALMVCAPATSPLRLPGDIDAAVEMQVATNADQIISVTPAARSPYFNMVTRDEAGRSRLFAEPPEKIARRQDAPPVFDMTTVVYVSKPEYVRSGKNFCEADIRSIIIPAERALDIDTELDFLFADFLMKRRDGIEIS